jgi:hypothetical protein
VTAQRQKEARSVARRAYAKPRVERVPIKLDEALLACSHKCKNRPHNCDQLPGPGSRS